MNIVAISGAQGSQKMVKAQLAHFRMRKSLLMRSFVSKIIYDQQQSQEQNLGLSVSCIALVVNGWYHSSLLSKGFSSRKPPTNTHIPFFRKADFACFHCCPNSYLPRKDFPTSQCFYKIHKVDIYRRHSRRVTSLYHYKVTHLKDPSKEEQVQADHLTWLPRT